MSSRICAVFQVIFRSLKYISVDTITTRYRVLPRLINAHDTFTTSHIVKEQPTSRRLGKRQRQTLGARALAFDLPTQVVVEDDGIEPTTPCLQSRCSPS